MNNPESAIDCDVVLKGGVMSGLVYARAFGRLSGRYRFRSIAGSSAGAIAAAFVAAAEYARQGGDAAGFERLEARCEALPGALPHLFRASPGFQPLLSALIHLAPGTGRARMLAAALCFWRPMALGVAAGGLILGGFYALLGASVVVSAPGLFFAAVIGAVAGLAGSLVKTVFVDLPRVNFGVCSGLAGAAEPPAITDWIHGALQEIAFGPTGRAEPLTFGDLAGRGVDLRVIATDLSHARMEVLPRFSTAVALEPAAWSRLLPALVMRSLEGKDGAAITLDGPSRLPVIAAVRMSIACPGLLEAVPLRAPDGGRLLMVDGGVAQNFPIDVFGEATGRPVLAFDFATLRSDRPDRITTVAEGLDGHDAPARLDSLRDYVWALIVGLREASTRAALLTPAHRGRTFQVWLAPTEGGMSLDMKPDQTERLMSYGEALADHVLKTQGGAR